MKRSLRIFLSCIHLAVFVFASVPEEFIHAFTNHHDTIESRDGVLAISIQHVHCQSLQLSLPSFSEATILTIGDLPAQPATMLPAVVLLVTHEHMLRASGRAPPCCA